MYSPSLVVKKLTIDEDALKADGIYDKYAVPTETFRFTQTKKK